MSDNQTIIEALEAQLAILEASASKIRRQFEELDADRSAVSRTIAILRGGAGATLGIDARDLRGMTQEQAIVYIAEKNDGRLLSGPTKELLLDAGLISNPKNAAGILYSLIQRSERFDQVKRGEYRLADKESEPEPQRDGWAGVSIADKVGTDDFDALLEESERPTIVEALSS